MYFIGWVENMHIKPFGELPFSFEALVGGQNKSNYRLRILYVLVFSVEFFWSMPIKTYLRWQYFASH
jgi:hypothetical protein